MHWWCKWSVTLVAGTQKLIALQRKLVGAKKVVFEVEKTRQRLQSHVQHDMISTMEVRDALGARAAFTF
jgi:hypothetical protein